MAGLKVFISYRREDCGGHASGLVGRIYDRLVDHYDSDNVFMDIDAIPPGVDFADHIRRAVAQADVLLAVVGPDWADLLQERDGQAGDFVRTEIAAALERAIPVVPLLLGGAPMPQETDMPENLKSFAVRNAFHVDSGRDFNAHISRLTTDLDRHFGNRRVSSTETRLVQVGESEEAIELLWISPGSFEMGSPEDEGHLRERPKHGVTLTRGFWLGRHPVTQGQFRALDFENPSKFLGGRRPVEQITWNIANAFSDQLTSSSRLEPREQFRLPTEAEWEYACRAGGDSPFSVGDGVNLKPADACFGSPDHGTAEVGEYPPNAWGFHDMHGNVGEWCVDYYGKYPSSAQIDPVHVTENSTRVLRGGCWFSRDWGCRSAFRGNGDPNSAIGGAGFRLLLQGSRP